MIKLIISIFVLTTLSLSAKTTTQMQDLLHIKEVQNNSYIENLQRNRKLLFAKREDSLDIRKFKEMKLHRNSSYRDMLVRSRDGI